VRLARLERAVGRQAGVRQVVVDRHTLHSQYGWRLSQRTGPNDLVAVLRSPAFGSYAASNAASGIANALLQAVILWQVYAISHSTLSLASVGLVGFVSALVSSVIGGGAVDAYYQRVLPFTSHNMPRLRAPALLDPPPPPH